MPFKPIIPLFHYIPPYFTIFQCIPWWNYIPLFFWVHTSISCYIPLHPSVSHCMSSYPIVGYISPNPHCHVNFAGYGSYIYIYTYCMYVLMLWTARDWSWLSPTCSWLSPILVCEIHTLPDYSEICWWLNHPSKHTPDIPEYIKLYPKILIDFVH